MATLADLQTEITAIFDQAGGSIDSSTNEYTRRTTLLNRALRNWAETKSYTWRELIKSTTLTTTPSQSYVDLPSDYKYGHLLLPQNQRLKVGNDSYQLLEYGDAINQGSSVYYLYITGNQGAGYRLNINPTPTEALNIPISYYSNELATNTSGTSQAKLVSSTDIPKCPSSDYLIYKTVAEMFLIDDEGDQYSQYKEMAAEEMKNMIINHELGEDNQGVGLVFVDEAQGFEPIGGYIE